MTDSDNVRSLTEKQAISLANAASAIIQILKNVPEWAQPVLLRGLLKGLKNG